MPPPYRHRYRTFSRFSWLPPLGCSASTPITHRRSLAASRDLPDPAPYTKTFFDLQLRLAHTVSALSGLPLARAILGYTNFYIRFGLGREFNPADSALTVYLAGLAHTI